jgi:hypothetical protein
MRKKNQNLTILTEHMDLENTCKKQAHGQSLNFIAYIKNLNSGWPNEKVAPLCLHVCKYIDCLIPFHMPIFKEFQ